MYLEFSLALFLSTLSYLFQKPKMSNFWTLLFNLHPLVYISLCNFLSSLLSLSPSQTFLSPLLPWQLPSGLNSYLIGPLSPLNTVDDKTHLDLSNWAPSIKWPFLTLRLPGTLHTVDKPDREIDGYIYCCYYCVHVCSNQGCTGGGRDRREEHSGEGEGTEQELGGKDRNAFAFQSSIKTKKVLA